MLIPQLNLHTAFRSQGGRVAQPLLLFGSRGPGVRTPAHARRSEPLPPLSYRGLTEAALGSALVANLAFSGAPAHWPFLPFAS